MKALKKDKFGNYLYSDQDIFDLLYQGYLDLTKIFAEKETSDISKFNNFSEKKIQIYSSLDLSIESFDQILQEEWFMPDSYKDFDICSWIMDQCKTNVELVRVQHELTAFENKNLINLLRWLKFFVDTCRENNIVWGVGRGSSVSSYVLFLIGVHRIDSIKYNLDYKEFLR